LEEYLDGVILSGSINTSTSGKSRITGSNFEATQVDFLLPSDYPRGSLVPDLTGFHAYSSGPGSFSYQIMDRILTSFLNARVATTQDVSLSGLQTIDGLGLSVGDRVLVKNQIDRTENGIYAAASSAWSRTSDANQLIPTELASGLDVWVQEGNLNGETGWSMSEVGGSEELVFDSVGFELGFIEDDTSISDRSYLGRILTSHSHQNALASGWETVRFTEPVGVSQTMLNSILHLKIIESLTFVWPSSTFRYRLLAATADSGYDIFGNAVRACVNRNKVSNLTANNAFWVSKPNPSKFAVESLYFDHLTEVTIDSIEVDPMTPGLIMSVYYSSEGDSAVSPDDWDNKLWSRVPRTYRLTHKNTFPLPQPISARFIKLEFSSLQAKPYNPGGFSRAVTYKKHPKWVLDYFLVDIEQKRLDNLVPTVVDVVHDAYALAFSYYQDEQRPLAPGELGKIDNFKSFLRKDDLIDLVDPITLSKINYSFDQYMISPAGKNGTLLSDAISAMRNAAMVREETIEEVVGAASIAIMTEVSTLNREKLMSELNYPEMFFFIECRHKYRIVETTFRNSRAYFAGIKGVRFIRDTYTNDSSPYVYNESFSDLVNIEINDFA
jgi:hypothetical protein